MRVRRFTPLISSQPAITWTSQPCEPSAANLLQHLLYTLSPFLTRWNYLPKSSPEAYTDFFNVFSQEEAKNMPPHHTVLSHHSPRWISLTFGQHPVYSVGDPYICTTALYGPCYHFHP